jgi:hypothetical protein
MNLTQQLKLAEISEPSPVSQWPAIGWWLLALFTLIATVVIVWYGNKYRHRRQRLKKSLRALDNVLYENTEAKSTAQLCGQFNVILKRHLAQAGLSQALALQGVQWREFLLQHLAAKYHDDIVTFLDRLYKPDTPDNKAGDQPQYWYQQVRHWLKSLPC